MLQHQNPNKILPDVEPQESNQEFQDDNGDLQGATVADENSAITDPKSYSQAVRSQDSIRYGLIGYNTRNVASSYGGMSGALRTSVSRTADIKLKLSSTTSKE